MVKPFIEKIKPSLQEKEKTNNENNAIEDVIKNFGYNLVIQYDAMNSHQ